MADIRDYGYYENNFLQDSGDKTMAELKLLKKENQKLKYYLNKIREEELSSLDIEWDEYETCCRTTDYSNIINLVEQALGERDE